MLSLTHCTIHQPPFWTWNEARGALKLPRWRMISVANPSIITKNGTIVVSYFNFPRDNYEQKQTRTPSLEYVIYVEYIVHSCRASFQIKNGGWVIRVYYSVSLALCNKGYGVNILPALRWTVSKQKQRMKDLALLSISNEITLRHCRYMCTARAARATPAARAALVT